MLEVVVALNGACTIALVLFGISAYRRMARVVDTHTLLFVGMGAARLPSADDGTDTEMH